MSTSFGWRKKSMKRIRGDLQQEVAVAFEEADTEDEPTEEFVDWLVAAKRRRGAMLEDAQAKSQRLREEGAMLAENERYWEAVARWDEALQLTPESAVLNEMKSQVLLLLGELFPAVQAAESAVHLDPTWCTAYQTLGRAQLGIGEINMALINFQKALHIDPSNDEIKFEDLPWSRELLQKKQVLVTSKT